jgi:hypothetical protein
VPPKANEHTSRPEKSGEPWVSRLGPYVVGVGAGVLIYGSLYWFPLVNGIDSPLFYQLAGVGFVAAIAVITWWAGGQEGSSSRDDPLRGIHGLDTGLYISTSTPLRMSLHAPLDQVASGAGRRLESRRSWCATSASYAGFLLRLDASGT